MSRISNHRPSPALLVALLALFVTFGGGAFAATSFVGSGGQIHGCVDKKGHLALVKAGKKCKPGQSKIGWNQTGPAGQKGDTGQTGLSTGPAGGDLTGSYPNPTLAASEGWHEVGAAGEPAFQNSWIDVAGTNETVGFYKDRGGVVHLKGSATGGGPGTIIFQLPNGYRPASGKILQFAVRCGCSSSAQPSGDTVSLPTGGVNISGPGFGAAADGGVSIVGGGSSFHLDGITFRAAS